MSEIVRRGDIIAGTFSEPCQNREPTSTAMPTLPGANAVLLFHVIKLKEIERVLWGNNDNGARKSAESVQY